MTNEKENKLSIKGSIIFLIVIALIVGFFVGKNYLEKKKFNDLLNTSEQIKEIDQLTARYKQLCNKVILTLQEIDEKKEIYKRLDKYFSKSSKELYEKFKKEMKALEKN